MSRGSKNGIKLSAGGSLDDCQRTQAANLFNQQLSMMGRDVASRHGNLLVEYGCQRERSPRRNIPSIYTYPISSRRRLVFRGFGVFYGDDSVGGIFVHRKDFQVEWTRMSRLEQKPWIPHSLPSLRRPSAKAERESTTRMLAHVVNWFVGYEAWIETELGWAFRRGQLSHYVRRGKTVQSWHPLSAWEELHEWLTDK